MIYEKRAGTDQVPSNFLARTTDSANQRLRDLLHQSKSHNVGSGCKSYKLPPTDRISHRGSTQSRSTRIEVPECFSGFRIDGNTIAIVIAEKDQAPGSGQRACPRLCRPNQWILPTNFAGVQFNGPQKFLACFPRYV